MPNHLYAGTSQFHAMNGGTIESGKVTEVVNKLAACLMAKPAPLVERVSPEFFPGEAFLHWKGQYDCRPDSLSAIVDDEGKCIGILVTFLAWEEEDDGCVYPITFRCAIDLSNASTNNLMYNWGTRIAPAILHKEIWPLRT